MDEPSLQAREKRDAGRVARLRLLAMRDDENSQADESSPSDGVPKTPSSLFPVKGGEDSPSAQPTTSPGTAQLECAVPTRNSHGKYECTWDDCDSEIKEFRRPSEWKKHMDKHVRPYKCDAADCLNLRGFTYYSGLLRHEKEVHGKNITAGGQHRCPHVGCHRHIGKGFSRDENLKVHLRRVHRNRDGEGPRTTSRIRTRDDHVDGDEVDSEEEEAQTKRRKTVADEDEMERLREQVRQLQEALTASEKNVVRLEAIEGEFKAFEAGILELLDKARRRSRPTVHAWRASTAPQTPPPSTP
ncbi:hypothetical protein AYO20_09109 [Fonsecaea nubica]|uniref:C2H2-type domain-containing protein n=1 Tax=Fonsecaea nubica TaxID=856822 RepID=A0A178CL37_9EURO|nr:hypothetical protein AYO20_09109 [Fonsecaea nubica]OAL29725.1 hypothetical protein AYO20_09109 [Fonsecaea nubica]